MAATAAMLAHRLASGPLLLDGAMGTELERRGLAAPPPLWSAAALLTAPEVVAQIHREYAAAGTDILVANTFRTNPRTLKRAGRLEAGADLNRLAIELARRGAAEARTGRTVWVAASVAPVEDCYSPELVPDDAALQAEHAQMMSWLRAAQPDLIWIETMNTLREARVAAQTAVAAGLPFVASFVVGESGELLGGQSLEDAVAAIEPLRPLALGLNCIPPRGLEMLLPRLRRATTLPVAAYAHVNNAAPIRGWSFAQTASPREYAAYAKRWVELGARIVGGCCGTSPAYIAAIAQLTRAAVG